VRIFKNTWFTRFAGKENITDDELREAVNQLEAGQADADLGSGVYKIRIARPGVGMKKYQSEPLMVLHQDAEGLHRLGIISDAEMSEFDEGCLIQEPEIAYEAEKSLNMEHATA